MITKVTTQTTVVTELTLVGDDIIDMLRVKYPDVFKEGRAMSVTFRVPSGGDYSGLTLDIDDVNPIIATVTVEYRRVD